MKLAIVQYASTPIISLELISSIENNINLYFENKRYGTGLSCIYIGILCVNPFIEHLFRLKQNRFDKKSTALTVEYKFDYDLFLLSNEKYKERAILNNLKSIPNIISEKKIKDFDIENFTLDFSNSINQLLNQ